MHMVISDKKMQLDSGLEGLFDKAVNVGIFPGAVVGVTFFSGRQKTVFLADYGAADYNGLSLNKSFYYDLASLTKPLATTLAILSLIKKNIISTEDTLPDLLKMNVSNDKKQIKLSHLLAHCSGLPAYKPYYKDSIVENGYNKDTLIKKIMAEKLLFKPGKRQLYSDLGFMVIGIIVEKNISLRLDEYIGKEIYKPMKLDGNLFFNFKNSVKKNVNYAPTENCVWRKRLLCGQVNDDNAFMMNGVAGQAGLFGNIYGVTDLISFLIDIIEGEKDHPNIARKDLQMFIKRQGTSGSFALGFDTPSMKNSSSGHYFSRQSFGHLGFTGTSFWVDLTKKISIVLLSNRVHPNRENNQIRAFRPTFYNTVMRIISGRENEQQN